MARVDGQEINIATVEKDTAEEQAVQLSDGLVFRSRYDVCKNATVNTLYNADGEVLFSQEVPGNGNCTRSEVEAFMQIVNSPFDVEEIRDQATMTGMDVSQFLESHAAR